MFKGSVFLLQLHVQRIDTDNDKIHIYVTENIIGNAVGRMLIDSANKAFVYLLENEHDEYLGVILPEHTWELLHNERLGKKQVFLQPQQIELVHFFDELTYLLENIRGNLNYGEELVQKVEHYFPAE